MEWANKFGQDISFLKLRKSTYPDAHSGLHQLHELKGRLLNLTFANFPCGAKIAKAMVKVLSQRRILFQASMLWIRRRFPILGVKGAKFNMFL